MLITPDQLQAITDTLSHDRCTHMVGLINELCVKYGIIEPLPFKMFLSNVLQESGEFSHKQENMNYSAARMVAVWPHRFALNPMPGGKLNANDYAHNSQKLSNAVYNGRMGNTDPNDGYTYRGGSFIGITGKELYSKYAKYIGKDITLAADLIHTDDHYALDASCWFFAVLKNLIPVARTGNFKEVCKRINGGLTGFDQRVKYYELCKKYL